jgi:YbbR domain-containing protein
MIEKILQRDMLVKVAAFVLALLMWVTALNDKNPLGSKTFTVELKFEAAAGRVITSTDVARAQVTFEGRETGLSQIKPDELKILVDVSKYSASSVTVPIIFASPYPGLEVTNVSPRQVTVGLDDSARKEVGVAVATRGVPNEDYDAEKPVAGVSAVVVTGPKKKVDQVQVAFGEVEVTGAVGAVLAKVPLSAKDPAGNDVSGVEIQPAEVDVNVPMKQKPPAKTVAVRADTTGTPKAGYRISRTTVSPEVVEIRGEASVTRQIDALFTKPVDVSDRDATFSYSANLVIPSGVTAKVTRVSVSVEIEEDIVEKTFTKVPVQAEGLPVGYIFDIEPPTVDVVLKGRTDILAGIKASDVQVYINAEAVETGGARQISRQLTVVPRGPLQDVSIEINIKPSFVTLTLTRR